MYIKIRFVFVISLLSISILSFGQGQGNSPYNTFGLGEITSETNASQDMMGGTGVSFANSFYVNQLNPALICKNRTIGFNKYVAFNVGMKGSYRIMNQNGKVQENFGMNLSNLTMVFPLTKYWAAGISIKPYSQADHLSLVQKQFEGSSLSNISEYRSQGGLSKVAFTNGFQLAKGLYWGFEGQYLFGNITRDSTSSLSGSAEYFRNSARTDFGGFSGKTGLAYQAKLNKKWFLNMGAAVQLGANLKGERLGIFSVLAENGNGPLYIQKPDTLSITSVKTQAPRNIRAGISLESPYHWVFGVDYNRTLWTGINQFESSAKKALVNSDELSLGLEWMPNNSSSKYLDQVFYRFGYKQGTMPFVINGLQAKDRSVSFGLSLPMGFRSPSYIDLGVAIGKRGSAGTGQIQENYTKISVNFSLLSSWFNKPKIE
jgi:hypothetical protein